MLSTVALFEAGNRLSESIDRVQAGAVIEITRRGKVAARLMPPESDEARQRGLDAMAKLREARQGVSLGGLSSRDLIRQGRR